MSGARGFKILQTILTIINYQILLAVMVKLAPGDVHVFSIIVANAGTIRRKPNISGDLVFDYIFMCLKKRCTID